VAQRRRRRCRCFDYPSTEYLMIARPVIFNGNGQRLSVPDWLTAMGTPQSWRPKAARIVADNS
jgi:hypothetical protein